MRELVLGASGFPNDAPPVLIENGAALVQAPQDAMFPPGLVTVLQRHTISEEGIRRIIAAATKAGLLSGRADFIEDGARRSRVAEIVFVIDGVEHRITGDPDRQIVCVMAPCEAPAGMPVAFGGLWAELSDLNGLVGEELGAAEAYELDRLALLLTEPSLDATQPPQVADWPVSGVSMRDFGIELRNVMKNRCGIVEGAEVATVIAALREGNSLTHWRDSNGDEYGIESRPLFPGEPDPCEAE